MGCLVRAAVTTHACFLLHMLAEVSSTKCNEICCVCQAQTSDKSLSSGLQVPVTLPCLLADCLATWYAHLTYSLVANCHHGHCVADYQLLVYGSKTHDAKYCKMCEELIVELKLQDNVKIMGLGKPTKILPTGWVYLQVRTCPRALMCRRLTMHEGCQLLLLCKDFFASSQFLPASHSGHTCLFGQSARPDMSPLLAELCDGGAACVHIGGWSVRRVCGVH